MQQVNTTEFRRHLFEYLDHLDTNPIELVRNGIVVARILPTEDKQMMAQKRLMALRETAQARDLE